MFMTAMPKADGNEPVHPGGDGADGDINSVTACRGPIGEAYMTAANPSISDVAALIVQSNGDWVNDNVVNNADN
jgi:hypothetical protein